MKNENCGALLKNVTWNHTGMPIAMTYHKLKQTTRDGPASILGMLILATIVMAIAMANVIIMVFAIAMANIIVDSSNRGHVQVTEKRNLDADKENEDNGNNNGDNDHIGNGNNVMIIKKPLEFVQSKLVFELFYPSAFTNPSYEELTACSPKKCLLKLFLLSREKMPFQNFITKTFDRMLCYF